MKARAAIAAHHSEGYDMGMADAFKLYIRNTRTFDFFVVDFLLRTDAWPDAERDRLMQLADEKGLNANIDYTSVLTRNWSLRKGNLEKFIGSVRNLHEADRLIDLSHQLMAKGVDMDDLCREYNDRMCVDSVEPMQPLVDASAICPSASQSHTK